jgi:hypothetical protein
MKMKNFAVKYPDVYAAVEAAAEKHGADLSTYILYACWKEPGEYGFNAAFYPQVTAEAYQRQREANDGETTQIGVPEYLWFSVEGNVADNGDLTSFDVYDVRDGLMVENGELIWGDEQFPIPTAEKA